mgnify:FL=1
MIIYDDKKFTPNQFAKELLIEAMEMKKEFWIESVDNDTTKISEKEIAQVHEQLRKRINGLLKYLGKNYYYPADNESEEK